MNLSFTWYNCNRSITVYRDFLNNNHLEAVLMLEGPHQVRSVDDYDDWLDSIDDARNRRRVARQIARMEVGAFGEYKYLREGIFEKKIDIGPGYRVYFTKMDGQIIILLRGGDKSDQDQDIKKAIDIASKLK